jgi:hypothetical protein
MAGLFRHTSFLLVLAAVCYVMAIYVTGGRIGFITFLVVGLTAELGVWLLGACSVVGTICGLVRRTHYGKANRSRSA